YKYLGYIINFLQDISYIYYQLPLLPRNFNIIILQPYKPKDKPCTARRIK
ncbi:hypothetical protein GE21DRAFT_1221410, partial [Neurospora crassa]